MAITDDNLVYGQETNISARTDMALQTEASAFPSQFSEVLQEFYKSHNIDISGDSISCYCPYRYIRLNPRYDEDQTLNMLRNEVRSLSDNSIVEDTEESKSNDNNLPQKPTSVLSVPWLETRWAFYALPANFPLSKSPCFRSGKIYGMDVSSGVGIAVLLTDYHDNTTVFNPGYKNQKVQPTSKEATKAPIGDKFIGTGELRILDLCCSPGLKLLQMADFFHQKSSTNSIDDTHRKIPVKLIGVDICKHRMDVCKKIFKKYFINSETSGRVGRSKELPSNVTVQLYLEDGTTFGVKPSPNALVSNNITASRINCSNLIFDSRVAIEEMQGEGKRKRMNKSARNRENKKLRQIAAFEFMKAQDIQNESSQSEEAENSVDFFDYILVDAECSTDGSFKHIKERIKESSSDNMKKDGHRSEENKRLTDPCKLAELVDLQRKLITSGFRLLKDGGTLVYCTCSLSEDQNEKVVKWLLESNQNAVIIPIHFPSIQNSKFVTEGTVAGTVRFYPNLFQSSESSTQLLGDGFFVAKIRKQQNIT